MKYELVRDAQQIQVERVISSRNNSTLKPKARITINDKFQHTFGIHSRVSKSLRLMSAQDLASTLVGGHYFFVDDHLVDFKNGSYNGFVHTDFSIARLVEHIGIVDDINKVFGHRSARLLKGNSQSEYAVLGNLWSKQQLTLPHLKEGGVFDSRIVFLWNPFVRTVNTLFQLVRLICSNGMIGVTDILNTKVPLINRWEEHLDIASYQIQNKVNSIAAKRLEQMTQERASLGELIHLSSHINERLEVSRKDGQEAEWNMLSNLYRITNPYTILHDVYHPFVFKDKRLAAQVAGHLTVFDLYNITTEVRSHTTETPKSTNLALDRTANKLIFDRVDITTRLQQKSVCDLSPHSSPEAAFFGLH